MSPAAPSHPEAQTRADEIERQWALIWGERWQRIPLTVLAIAMTAIYLPIWVVVLCAAANVGLEFLTLRTLRGLEAAHSPKHHVFVGMINLVMEMTYVLPAALVYQMDENYAKAFAVGMVCTNLIHLIGERSIYLALGRYCLAGNALTMLLGNAVYWLRVGDYNGLLVSSIAATGALAYTYATMRSNHELHSRAARDRAAAIDSAEAKSQFLAQMSHELRTPLNAILGMGHAEHRRTRDALSQNRLSVLIAAAEGLTTILDDLLDQSAIEAGRAPIRLKTVKPRDEIEAILLLFQPAMQDAGLKLSYDIAPSLSQSANLDPQRLRQCLSNMLSNALKNTVHGGVHVTATAQPDPGGMILSVEVADTGPGIPFHLHSALFDTLTPGRTPRAGTESNGLGLSISRSIARQMGGDLTLLPNSSTHSGARFVLTLPTPPAPPPDKTPAPPPKTPGKTSIAAGLCVLVIDDIATNRLVASTYLRMLGALMIEADSGAQALTLLAENTPDLILLDMNMPGLDGLQTLERIRALPGAAGKVPIIALTANALDDQRKLYLSSGVDGYLAKPINPARLEAEIRNVLGKGSSHS